MKKPVFILISIFAILFSCQRDQNSNNYQATKNLDLNQSNVSNYVKASKLGIHSLKDDQRKIGTLCGDEIIEISEDQLIAYYMDALKLDPLSKFSPILIQTYENEEGRTEYVISTSATFNKTISHIKTGPLDLEGDFYILVDGTRTCTCTAKCGLGCDASINGPWCSCSPCSDGQDCTKTSTVTSPSNFCYK